MTDLKDKIVIITGASSGFGEDAARLFAKEGCKVVLAARRLDRLQELAERIQKEGGEAIAVPVDVTELAEIDNMVQTVMDVYGHVDILFNNAGFGRHNWLEAHDPQHDIEPQVNANLLGLINVTRAVLPHMLKRGEGHIINMSSIAGWIAVPTYSIYASTKFGIRGFTDSLRRELAPVGIHVSGIYPAFASTEFSKHSHIPTTRRRLGFLRRLSMPSEYVARRVVGVARSPRRALILPWWYHFFIGLEFLFPSLIDYFVIRIYKHRNSERKE
ncbi:MAG TPA: SDR family oxidoreductase [Anaerolineales bacterium]|jgi:NADP-dependent 3-hydroxy acid dehydrogenase YdfG|nr:SDR family oxidoreductase [Anaerolineales bacterium]